MIGPADWARMFVPQTPLLEIVLRGTLSYLAIFVMLRVVRRNMRLELITKEELMGLLREQGVGDLAQVQSARMESNGRLSVVTRDAKPHRPPEQRAT